MTTTVSTADMLPHKVSSAPSTGSLSMEATLQSLYNRAARAFLHRDVTVTFTLLNTAFALLSPPLAPSPEPLDAHRRKWDILRITLETTVFSSAPDLATLPQPLRESLLLSPQSFISTLYARSLKLFTPSSLPRKPSSAFLPHQILITLVASSIKVDCPNFGREITEDWLSKRGQYDFIPSAGEAYYKVLEIYCLHVLPRLGEWEYVREFLSYENELSSDKRRELFLALEALHAQAQESTRRETPKPETPPSPTPALPPRSLSPASSSSSLSTTSTRTAVPASPRPKIIRRQSTSSASAVSDATVTRSPRHRHGKSTPRGSPSTSLLRASRIPRNLPVDHSLATVQPPTSLSLIRSYFSHYFTANRIVTLSVLFFLIPLLSLIIRRRRRIETPADQVRRRLLEARGDSIARQLWNELVRAVLDTVRMGGGGLV
ncbi:hypothetical protein DEU56DRAFT_912487 [Suillus clintonianus]|uniref:uncharacterized protein n=1 Tax=Suillus clintonianus TaxID=1904413 RepID=UPI001B8660CE|nr:uncharacterized protein DEU56DRAFT_912487 [Suillus clintonianus]KAG2138329.1 hypothetical protein DEU56DRAFT_912487 [Suillus clintonianus]